MEGPRRGASAERGGRAICERDHARSACLSARGAISLSSHGMRAGRRQGDPSRLHATERVARLQLGNGRDDFAKLGDQNGVGFRKREIDGLMGRPSLRKAGQFGHKTTVGLAFQARASQFFVVKTTRGGPKIKSVAIFVYIDKTRKD